MIVRRFQGVGALLFGAMLGLSACANETGEDPNTGNQSVSPRELEAVPVIEGESILRFETGIPEAGAVAVFVEPNRKLSNFVLEVEDTPGEILATNVDPISIEIWKLEELSWVRLHASQTRMVGSPSGADSQVAMTSQTQFEDKEEGQTYSTIAQWTTRTSSGASDAEPTLTGYHKGDLALPNGYYQIVFHRNYETRDEEPTFTSGVSEVRESRTDHRSWSFGVQRESVF